MPIFRWGHHWNALHDIEREVDRLLQSVNLTFQTFRMGRQYPPINLYELEDEYLLTAELPGVTLENLELTVAGGVLTLKGKRNELKAIPEDRFRRQERPQGAWQRSLTLPDRVDEEGLTAEFTNGVLKVHLPKAPEARARHIPVMEGEG
ncbi:MAG TPA: Hsp20/alpha crystallin family protein [Planctomycetaceae bacterium]|nr:Hsp20/alpha crystallin family protein [Planctomycetaceae bacterium]